MDHEVERASCVVQDEGSKLLGRLAFLLILSQPGKLWKDLEMLMSKSDDAPSPTSDDAKQAADFFMEFFVDKIEQIRETTNGAPPPVFADRVGSNPWKRSSQPR